MKMPRILNVRRLSRFSIVLSATAAAGAMLTGCETGPQVVSAEKRASAVVPQHESYAQFGYRVEWRGFPTMTTGEVVERMEILDDLVAVQESGSVLTVLETRSGERRWSDPVASPLTKFVGLTRHDKNIIVSSESDAFFYDADTGALQTKQKLSQVVNTRPIVIGPLMVYGCSNGQVLAHNTLSGYRQWGSFLDDAIEIDPVRMNDDGVIGIVARSGDLLILNGEHGFAYGRNRMFGGTDVSLAASETTLFVASTDHSLYAFNREGASESWRKRTDAPLKFAPAYHDGKVYCDMGGDGVCAFEAYAGSRVWTNPKLHGTVIGMRKSRLMVWDGATASLINPGDGSVVESVKLDNVAMIKSDNFVDGNLYLASASGVVTKLVPRN
ncbi:MAG: PQQ-binding-like beta-propeller repeat protein [Phycisphaerales bacterium]|nr:PQQ-binding-like beta-propeller repeat protein [Phycisphaerales bacterium]